MNDADRAEVFKEGWEAGYQAGTDTAGTEVDDAWRDGYEAGLRDA